MLWLPFDRLTLVTARSHAETIAVLNEATGELRLNLFGPSSEKPFIGEIHGARSQIRRDINYRNSFLPVISGEFEAQGPHVLIHLRMRMIVFTMIFMAFWMIITLPLASISLLSLLGKSFFEAKVELIALAFPIFGYLLCMCGFHYERRKSIRALKELLSATELPRG